VVLHKEDMDNKEVMVNKEDMDNKEDMVNKEDMAVAMVVFNLTIFHSLGEIRNLLTIIPPNTTVVNLIPLLLV
jgi:hypothetical protein